MGRITTHIFGECCRCWFVGSSYPVARKLGDVVKLGLLEKETKEGIESIWKRFYANHNYVVSGSFRRTLVFDTFVEK